MCETILILAVTTFATAQIFHNRDFNNFPHPRSFASNFDVNRRFGENQFGLERRDVRYRNDGNWNADRDHSFEREYPYRPEHDSQYDNRYNNRFNPNFQQNSGVGQRRNNHFGPENFDGETFDSKNSENEYHSNIENKYKNVNINLNSRSGAEGQDYNHQQTEFKSAIQKQRRERNNEFFNENSRSDFYNQNTAFKSYIRKESGDVRNFDSENIDSLAKISNQNAELNKNTRLAKSRVADKSPSAEHNETTNNKTLNDSAEVINETNVKNVTNQIVNAERKASVNDTTSDNKDSERNQKTNDMWVWDIEDKANITTTTTTSMTPVTPDVDDRAAFDGGQCASGKIKVGNECVDVD